jgi:A/G-specific adenine glycosylase
VPAVPTELRDAILAWFDANGRDLAFRADGDPYAVLVSEAMAQQTQISRVVPAWQAWMARFPTIASLADAPTADVLRQWAGLGYDRRALNLQRAARAIVADHRGRMPDTVDGLMTLPGVGPYTARAVAAIAFGRPVGAVDTNVRRVLGRTVMGTAEIDSKQLQTIADASVPVDRPAAWTHALMDVGATFCRPRTPRCEPCPAKAWCRFATAGEPTLRSPRRRRPAATTPFPQTTRWLRGRILDTLRGVDGWHAFTSEIGTHDAKAVHRALAAMSRDGLLEIRQGRVGIEAQLPEG